MRQAASLLGAPGSVRALFAGGGVEHCAERLVVMVRGGARGVSVCVCVCVGSACVCVLVGAAPGDGAPHPHK